MRTLPLSLADCEIARVLEVTNGFTGADMKRVVDDAKGLFAFDRSLNAAHRKSTEFFVEAASGVRENKIRYEQAQSASQASPRTGRPDYYYPPTPD